MSEVTTATSDRALIFDSKILLLKIAPALRYHPRLVGSYYVCPSMANLRETSATDAGTLVLRRWTQFGRMAGLEWAAAGSVQALAAILSTSTGTAGGGSGWAIYPRCGVGWLGFQTRFL